LQKSITYTKSNVYFIVSNDAKPPLTKLQARTDLSEKTSFEGYIFIHSSLRVHEIHNAKIRFN
jgi:hypothetical protein